MRFVDLTDRHGEKISVAPVWVMGVFAAFPGYDISKGGCVVVLSGMNIAVRESRDVVVAKLEQAEHAV